MDVKETRRNEDFDRLLLLLATEPKSGFEDAYAELCKREVDRLLRPAGNPDQDGDGE